MYVNKYRQRGRHLDRSMFIRKGCIQKYRYRQRDTKIEREVDTQIEACL